MKFSDWLTKYIKADTIMGDFARDVSRDRGFPAEQTYRSIRWHLVSRHACKEALSAFDRAWRAYKREFE